MANGNNKKEVVKAAPPKLPVADIGDLDLAQLQRDAGLGVSDMLASDVALPYIGILQALSPQVQPGHSAYIEGASASMFYNNVSNEAYEGRSKGIIFVPCYLENRVVQWHDREDGGGYVTDYPYPLAEDMARQCKLNDKGKRHLGHDILVDTAYHYGYFRVEEDGVWLQCVLPLKSTGLKVHRKWNNDLAVTKIPGTDFIAPRWLYPYHLTTVIETRKNNSWWQLHVERIDKIVNKAMYEKAKIFNELLAAGDIKRAAPPSETPMGGTSNGDEIDAPF